MNGHILANKAMTNHAERTVINQLPASIWALGFVSMLMDISSEMVHSLLPMFLAGTLGISALSIGFIEGLAESTAMIVKVFSGSLSDWLGRRKMLALVGYTMGAFSKPLFALATGGAMVVGARFMDRVGKGIRGAPRDAMVADIAPPNMRGAAFGLRQSLDTVGAFLGPLIATGLMLLWANDFRMVFWVAVIPGFLSVCVLAWAVKEPISYSEKKRINPFLKENLMKFDQNYWWVVGVGIFFALARFSEAFIVLRSYQLGIPMAFVPLVMVAMNLIYALTAYPFGKLSDRMNHSTLMAWGLVVLIASDFLLAWANDWSTVLLGVALWGVHMGMTQGLLSAMVANASPPDLRGTSFGIFNLVTGVAALISSIFAGWAWDDFGASATFLFGSGFALICLVALLRMKKIFQPK